ncbi:uncharacterized protein LOC126672268 [Mercurialis annua]|uniref:uncharacterized protein LOC126672268 n=1 Tax=Mercurialis annua TaxID=3986 RepID=UPI00215F380B|nr:uncharacterized protein LOC126672268 [Mercurialis annua]
MKTLCWNVQGLGSPRTFKSLCDRVHKINPGMVFLMETKSKACKLEALRKKLKMAEVFGVDSDGKGGGLALFWSENLTVLIISSSNWYIDCMIKDETKGFWRFTGFYGNPKQSQRVHSWTLLTRLSKMFKGPWLVGGDFNEILSREEKSGGAEKPLYLMQNFKWALEDSEVFDAGGNEGGFTWWGNRSLGAVKEKLDRFLMNLEWQNMFSDYSVQQLDLWGSDHKPILMCSENKEGESKKGDKKGSRFHFEEVWTSKQGFKEVVHEFWNKSTATHDLEDIKTKLKVCEREFKRWGRNFYGNMKKEITKKRDELKRLVDSNDPSITFDQIREVEKSLDEMLFQEEIKWKQKSRADWLAFGDKNTGFFHRKASKRRARNKITGLNDAGGNWKENPGEVQSIIQDYFGNLFDSAGPSDEEIEAVTRLVKPVITGEMNQMLCAEFKAGDVVQALKEMEPTKAPGIDGYPALFFQKYWDIVGTDITKEDFGLCYSVAQSAFVPGRQIIDSALIGFECVHLIKNSTRKTNVPLALKLDMSKAYDRVEWKFLEKMLLSMGCCRRWVEKILNCITSVEFSFLINGSVKGHVQPRRGLRQGDPLSPYLFLICAQGLSCLINNAVEEGKMHGMLFGEDCQISHLFFADDSLLFAREDVDEVKEIKGILEIYGKASGQVINFDKSALCFGKGIQSEMKNEIQSIIQVEVVKCHERYLGLPSTVGRNKKDSFQAILDIIGQKLQAWKVNLFSSGGKEVLIKAIIQSIPNYYMNCFKLPLGLIEKIEKLCNRFWWGSVDGHQKIHWSKWRVMCRAKCRGGMGFKDLVCFNKSMLAKQGWNLITKPESLLARVLRWRYYKDGNFMSAQCPRSSSYTWRSIIWAREILQNGIRWRVGDGKTANVYTDKWLPRESTFKVWSTPKLSLETKVNDLISDSGGWNRSLIEANFSKEDAEVICNIPLACTTQEDKLRWHYDRKGVYTVRSGYHVAIQMLNGPTISEADNNLRWWNFFMEFEPPLEVKCNLINRGMKIDHYCPRCNSEPETVLHVFWSCDYAQQIWSLWEGAAKVKPGKGWSIQDMMVEAFKRLTKADFVIFGMMLWIIWSNRNNMIFGKKGKPTHQVLEWALSYIEDYQQVKDKLENRNRPDKGPKGCEGDTRWIPPREGSYCVQVDAGFDNENGKFSSGYVIRDWRGDVKGSGYKRYEGRVSVEVGEAMAVRDGIIRAKEANLTPFRISSDSKVVVDSFNNNDGLCNDVNLIIVDCLNLFSRGDCIDCSYINRKLNMVAHSLARKALYERLDCFSCRGFVPQDLMCYILADKTALP